jgi:hypothetical protein
VKQHTNSFLHCITIFSTAIAVHIAAADAGNKECIQNFKLCSTNFIIELRLVLHSARNGNLEVPVYLLKEKAGYTVRKWKKR